MNPEFSDWNDAIDEYTRYDEDIALMKVWDSTAFIVSLFVGLVLFLMEH